MFVLCPAEGRDRKSWGEIKQWKLEWNGGGVKNKKVEVVKSRTRLGTEKPFYVFRHCLTAVLSMHQIPTQ